MNALKLALCLVSLFSFSFADPKSTDALFDEFGFSGPYGNWIIHLNNSPGPKRLQLSIWPKEIKEGKEPEYGVIVTTDLPENEGVRGGLEVNSISDTQAVLKEWNNYREGSGIDQLSLTFEDSGKVSGTWINNEGEKGSLTGLRAVPVIERIEIKNAIDRKIASYMHSTHTREGVFQFSTETPKADFNYDAHWWSNTSNNMRGNRPEFIINFYGKNLWGVSRSQIKGNPSFEFRTGNGYVDSDSYEIWENYQVIGRKIEINIWDQPPPGIYEFNTNGIKFPFELVVRGYPPPPLDALYIVNEEGQKIEKLKEGDVFAFEEKFSKPNTIQKFSTITLMRSGRTHQFITAKPLPNDASIHRSGFYQLRASGSMLTEEEKGRQKEIRAQFAALASGDWILQQTNLKQNQFAYGRINISTDGNSGTLKFTKPESSRTYELVDVTIQPENTTSEPTSLKVHFSPKKAESEPITTHPSAIQFLQPETEPYLSFTSFDKRADIPVVLLGTEDSSSEEDSILFDLSTIDAKRLIGKWLSTESFGELEDQGSAWWTRGMPVIKQIVVEENQRDPNKRFGYIKEAESKDKNWPIRRLLVFGENLPIIQGGPNNKGTAPQSKDPKLDYQDFSADEDMRDFILKKKFEKQGIERPQGDDLLIVSAKLKPGVKAGSKTLSLGLAESNWTLLFNDDQPDIRFTRERYYEAKDEIAVFYPTETAYIVLDINYDGHLKNSKKQAVMLFAKEDGATAPIPLGLIDVERVEEGSKPTFRSKGITLVKAKGSEPPKLNNPDSPKPAALDKANKQLSVRMKPGWSLIAAPKDKALRVDPASMNFELPDKELGKEWLEALKTVARCNEESDDIKDPIDFASEKATVFSKGIYASRIVMYVAGKLLSDKGLQGNQWRNNDVPLQNGDHAAALLIRKEFVKRMSNLLPKYETRANDPQRVRAFLHEARRHRGASNEAFWKLNMIYSVRFPGGLPLNEVLDVSSLSERLDVSKIEAEVWALDEVQAAMKKRVERMSEAVISAQTNSPCDIDKILLFAGYDAPDVIHAVTSKLVINENGRWVPHDQAIRYVKGLHIAGGAIRALKEYSDIDNSYNAMAVAVVTAGTTGMLGSAGAISGSTGLSTAASYTSFIGNALDMTFVGGYGVYDYFDKESEYALAEGVAPVMGDQALEDAAKLRKNALMTAVGILFPARSVRGEWKAIKGMGSVSRGKELLSNGLPDDLDSLNDLQKADIAAYYDDLLGRRFRGSRNEKGLQQLSADELEDFRSMSHRFNSPASRPERAEALANKAKEPAGSRSAERGKKLTQSGLPEDIDSLTDTQKVDLKAYRDYLLKRRYKVGQSEENVRGLSEEELATYKDLNKRLNSNRPTPSSLDAPLAEQAERGKSIADSGIPEDFDSLPDANRVDLKAYYDSLLERHFKLGQSEGNVKRLSEDEMKAYRDLNKRFNKRPTQPSADDADVSANRPTSQPNDAPTPNNPSIENASQPKAAPNSEVDETIRHTKEELEEIKRANETNSYTQKELDQIKREADAKKVSARSETKRYTKEELEEMLAESEAKRINQPKKTEIPAKEKPDVVSSEVEAKQASDARKTTRYTKAELEEMLSESEAKRINEPNQPAPNKEPAKRERNAGRYSKKELERRLAESEPQPINDPRKTAKYTQEDLEKMLEESEVLRRTPRPTPIEESVKNPDSIPEKAPSPPVSSEPASGGSDEFETVMPPTPSDDSTGAFKIKPLSAEEAREMIEANRAAQIERAHGDASWEISQPHQGRKPMDTFTRLENELDVERLKAELKEQEEYYRMEHIGAKATPEYAKGLEDLRTKYQTRIEAAEADYGSTQKALEGEHEIMDVVEKHLGSRVYPDYLKVRLQKARPGNVVSKEEAILGVLYDRFGSRLTPTGQLKSTGIRHRRALESLGMSRSEIREKLGKWIDPHGTVESAKVDKAVDDYLAWAKY